MTSPRPNYQDFDSHNFFIPPHLPESLIDSLPERDDECAFARDMYNFGEQEDLPNSDRLMDKRCKNN